MTSGQIFKKEIELTIPLYINLNQFLINQKGDLSVSFIYFEKKSPIKIRGRKARVIAIDVFGPDCDLFLDKLDLNLDNFLEASGFFG